MADPVFLLLVTGLFLFQVGVFLLFTYRNLLRLVLADEKKRHLFRLVR